MDALGGHGRMTGLAVLGATGAVGSRFVEIVAGEGRVPVRAVVHRWWHTARIVRVPIELRAVAAGEPSTASATDALAAALAGSDAVVSFVDGPTADAGLATALVHACTRSRVRRLVHLGCLGSFGAVRRGRLDAEVAPPRPPGADAARRWAFEQALLDAGDQAGLEVAVVTAPLVYGPFTQGGAHIPHDQVVRGRVAVARGSGPCHVIYVDDVVEAMWRAATVAPPVRGRIFVSGPAPITWDEFFGAFEAIVGRPAVAVVPDDELAALVGADPAARAELRWPPPPSTGARVVGAVGRRVLGRSTRPVRRRLVLPAADELASRAIDVEVPLDRAAALLGWAPAVGFADGMRRTAAYLRWADPADPADPAVPVARS